MDTLNCGAGEDSWESLGLQGDPTSPSWGRSVLGVHWKDWCWRWNSYTLATSWEELTHLKNPDTGRNWEQKEKGTTEDEMAGWHHWLDGRGSEWTPGVVLRFMGLWRVGHDWATELTNWTNIQRRFSSNLTWFLLDQRKGGNTSQLNVWGQYYPETIRDKGIRRKEKIKITTN